jgi:hypothetical protein
VRHSAIGCTAMSGTMLFSGPRMLQANHLTHTGNLLHVG